MNIPYISAEEVRKNLSMEDAIQCTENVYKLKSQDKTVVWPTIFYEFDPGHAAAFASKIRAMLQTDFAIEAASVTFEGVSDLKEAVSDSDIIITITPSHTPLIQKEWVKPGTHFSCIGADMAGKEEIDSQIFEDAIVFVDDLEHCRNAGEIEIPLKQGTLSEDRICGELGDLILGKAAGRKSDTDITVFDSTGMALLDLAVADFLLKKNR